MPPFPQEGVHDIASAVSRARSGGFAFGPFLLDGRSGHLLRDSQPIAATPRQCAVLLALVSADGKVVSKDRLIEVGWNRIVSDSSLEKLICELRKVLGDSDDQPYIKTVSGRGYQCVAPVTRIEAAKIDVDIYALLAPDRVWGEGLAALEKLNRDELLVARTSLEVLVVTNPGTARFHCVLAMACAFLFDSTRADPRPDAAMLQQGAVHAHEAVRLSPSGADAWSTLGFILERTGDRVNALAALRRATRLDPLNWLNFCRLAMVAWGPERLGAVQDALALNPGLAIARLFTSALWIASNVLDRADRELDIGIAAMRVEVNASPRFSAVALFVLKALLCVVRGDLTGAIENCDRELALERRGHIYGRESCANAWYVKGACYLLLGNHLAARAAFIEALNRVAYHPMAIAGLEIVDAASDAPRSLEASSPSCPRSLEASFPRSLSPSSPPSLLFEREMARAVPMLHGGDVAGAVAIVLAALRAAPPGNSGWSIPVDPLLRVWENPTAWAPVLEVLYLRAR